MKRLLGLLLSLALFCGCAGAFATEVTESGTCGDAVAWTLFSDGKLVISGTGAITSAPWRDSSHKDEITGAEIQEGVTQLSDFAFQGLESLAGVSIPASLEKLGDHDFVYCPSLLNITVAGGNPNYTSEKGVVFSKDKTVLLVCPGGKAGDYTIPSTVTEIGPEAFFDCRQLTGATIPAGVTKIGKGAFYRCFALKTADVPAGVSELEKSVFEQCSSLTSVTLRKGMKTIGVWAFWGCGALKEITVPKGVSEIKDEAFSNCGALKKAVIPDSVKVFGKDVFDPQSAVVVHCSEGSPADQYALAQGLRVSYTGSYDPSGDEPEPVDEATTLQVDESREFEDSATIAGPFLDQAFKATSSNKKVVSIEWIARGGNLTVNGSTTYYFTICLKGLKPGTSIVTLYDNSKTIRIWQKKITVVGEIGPEADYEDERTGNHFEIKVSAEGTATASYLRPADDTEEAVVPGTVSVYGTEVPVTAVAPAAFRDNTNLRAVTIAAGVKAIGSNAFNGCTKLKTVNLGNSLATIGSGAFRKCTSLAKITIPKNVKKIGKNAFNGCKKLKTITVKTTKLKKSGIGKNSFKGIAAKAAFKVPKKSLKNYKKWLKNPGGAPKTVKIR